MKCKLVGKEEKAKNKGSVANDSFAVAAQKKRQSARIPDEKVKEKLIKLQSKIQETILKNDHQRFLQMQLKDSSLVMNDHDKHIIERSMLGTFNSQFDAKEFESQFPKIRNVFQ